MFFCYVSRPKNFFWMITLTLWMPSSPLIQPQHNSTPTQLNLILTQPQLNLTLTRLQLNFNLNSSQTQPQFSLTSTSNSNQPQLHSQLNLNPIWLWHKSNPILFYRLFNGKFEKCIIHVNLGDLGKNRSFDRIYTHALAAWAGKAKPKLMLGILKSK